jgi:hypothetical protein
LYDGVFKNSVVSLEQPFRNPVSLFFINIPNSFADPARLDALAAPDVLQETISLRKAVHGVVALAHGADEAGQGVDVVLSGDGAAVLVNLGDRDLDRAVILGLDDAVGGAALARDVKVDDITTVVLHFGGLKRFKGLIDTDCETFGVGGLMCFECLIRIFGIRLENLVIV